MKMMFSLVLCLAVISSADATIRRVAKDGSGDFTGIQAAVDASPAGDTVVVMGDLGPYNGNTAIVRPITLIGQGSRCSVSPWTHVIGDFYFNAGSSQSTIEGFHIQDNSIRLAANVTGLTIRNCYIWVGTNDDHCIFLAAGASALVENCGLDGYASCVLLNGTLSNVTVKNCFLWGATYSQGAGIDGYDASSTATVSNSVFAANNNPLFDVTNWSVDHCIFWDNAVWNGAVSGTVLASYNAFQASMTSFPFVSGVDSVILTDPFANYDEAANYQWCVTDFSLPANSGLINRGDPNAAPDRDGSRRDIGLYGGPTPFVDTGAPDFPFVTQMFVPATVPQNGVLEIRSTGRVGPGN